MLKELIENVIVKHARVSSKELGNTKDYIAFNQSRTKTRS